MGQVGQQIKQREPRCVQAGGGGRDGRTQTQAPLRRVKQNLSSSDPQWRHCQQGQGVGGGHKQDTRFIFPSLFVFLFTRNLSESIQQNRSDRDVHPIAQKPGVRQGSPDSGVEGEL